MGEVEREAMMSKRDDDLRREAALSVISSQLTTDEMGDEQREQADYEYAYNAMIGVARAALHTEASTESEGGGDGCS